MPALSKFKFCFSEISAFFSWIFLICSCLNPQMWNPRTQRADYIPIYLSIYHLSIYLSKSLYLAFSSKHYLVFSSMQPQHFDDCIIFFPYYWTFRLFLIFLYLKYIMIFFNCWDFPGSPVVRTPRFHHRRPRFDPWSGN